MNPSPRRLIRRWSGPSVEIAKAWAFFQSQPPSYRRTSIFWVMEARRAETRERRFEILRRCSADGERIPLLRREKPGRK